MGEHCQPWLRPFCERGRKWVAVPYERYSTGIELVTLPFLGTSHFTCLLVPTGQAVMEVLMGPITIEQWKRMSQQ